MTVNVAAVNDAPVAVDDTLAATEDTPVTYTAAQLLGNDTDVDGNPLTIASVTSGDRRHRGAQRQRHGDVHAGGELQRRGELQLHGERRRGHQQHRDGDGQRRGGQRRAGCDRDTLAATEDTAVTYTAAQLLGNDTDVDSATRAVDRLGDERDRRHRGAQRRRHGDLHAEGELQRRGELQLHGERRHRPPATPRR